MSWFVQLDKAIHEPNPLEAERKICKRITKTTQQTRTPQQRGKKCEQIAWVSLASSWTAAKQRKKKRSRETFSVTVYSWWAGHSVDFFFFFSVSFSVSLRRTTRCYEFISIFWLCRMIEAFLSQNRKSTSPSRSFFCNGTHWKRVRVGRILWWLHNEVRYVTRITRQCSCYLKKKRHVKRRKNKTCWQSKLSRVCQGKTRIGVRDTRGASARFQNFVNHCACCQHPKMRLRFKDEGERS